MSDFKASPWILRVFRHRRRWARWQFARLMFRTGIWNPNAVVGRYERTRLGVTETMAGTRLAEEQGRYFIKPPDEWSQREADSAIARAQFLAKKYGW